MTEDNRKYTVFTTEYGKYYFIHVSIGIHIAIYYYTTVINETVKGLDFSFAYLAEIII